MNLRDHVEAILPEWERWYPSLFDAAADLGVIRARDRAKHLASAAGDPRYRCILEAADSLRTLIGETVPAIGAVTMNLSANMLGLDNAATPLGIKAMKELQELNPTKEVASDDQILFLTSPLLSAGSQSVPLITHAWRAMASACGVCASSKKVSAARALCARCATGRTSTPRAPASSRSARRSPRRRRRRSGMRRTSNAR